MRYSEFSCEKHQEVYDKKLANYLDLFYYKMGIIDILDYGCGRAGYIKYLKTNYNSITLIDKYNQNYINNEFKNNKKIFISLNRKYSSIQIISCIQYMSDSDLEIFINICNNNLEFGGVVLIGDIPSFEETTFKKCIISIKSSIINKYLISHLFFLIRKFFLERDNLGIRKYEIQELINKFGSRYAPYISKDNITFDKNRKTLILKKIF